MFFLAGLMGMMMLGSMAVVVTAETAVDEGDADGFAGIDDGADAPMVSSLFQQMGIGQTAATQTGFDETALSAVPDPAALHWGPEAAPPVPPEEVEANSAAPLVLTPADLIEPRTSPAEAPQMAFDPLEDQLVIVFDDSDAGAEPRFDLRPSAGDPDMTEIYVDGALVMVLPTEDMPPPEAIVLVGESAAQELGVA